MQSCLESVSIDARNTQQVRSDYNSDNKYSGTHPDAIGGQNADSKGKGTGASGHSHSIPDCKGTLGVINYSNFDTDISNGAGNDVDQQSRNTAIVRSLYSPYNKYSSKLIDTTLNVREGQYRVP